MADGVELGKGHGDDQDAPGRPARDYRGKKPGPGNPEG